MKDMFRVRLEREREREKERDGKEISTYPTVRIRLKISYSGRSSVYIGYLSLNLIPLCRAHKGGNTGRSLQHNTYLVVNRAPVFPPKL